MAQAKKKTTIRRRRARKNIEQGQVHIQSTFNNTIEMCIRDSTYGCSIC